MDTRGISAASTGCDWCTWPSMEPNPLAAVRVAVLIGWPLAHGNFVWAPSSTEQQKVNRGGKKNQIEAPRWTIGSVEDTARPMPRGTEAVEARR